MAAIVLEDSKGRRMSDEEFEKFCQQNRDLRIERNSNFEVSIMSPNTPLSGFHETEVLRQLSNWNFKSKKGIVFSSSAGFTLPDNSIFSPDASWMSNKRWADVTQEEREKFSHVCPEFVIEVRSKSDSLNALKEKMQTWIRNDVQLAWLIDVKTRTTWIYRPVHETVELKDVLVITGEAPVEGFNLDLRDIYG